MHRGKFYIIFARYSYLKVLYECSLVVMPELTILRPINVTYHAGSHPRTSDTFLSGNTHVDSTALRRILGSIHGQHSTLPDEAHLRISCFTDSPSNLSRVSQQLDAVAFSVLCSPTAARRYSPICNTIRVSI